MKTLEKININIRNYEESIEELEYVLAHKDLFELKCGDVVTRLKVSECLQSRMENVFSLESFFNTCERLLEVWKIELEFMKKEMSNLSNEFFNKANKFKKYLENLFDEVKSFENTCCLETYFIINHFIEITLSKDYFRINLKDNDIKNIEKLKAIEETLKILIENYTDIKEYLIKEFNIKNISL